ncbi:hypothetical protein [Pseudomonas sp. Irchel 3E13]|uniref:hypothetical protein n=1 Tax=Pseudomonas sp. Irchel 3E13 TaxID=2008975 RepID=UPI000BA49EC1|nr:hypothetical protein [Pseudomonas sp. Irchel 3E13]
MASLTTSQIHAVGEWCAERGMLPQRIDAADIKAACASLGIALVAALSQHEVEAISDVCEDATA